MKKKGKRKQQKVKSKSEWLSDDDGEHSQLSGEYLQVAIY